MNFLFDLILTLILYGSFPMVYAFLRKEKITKKKYRRTCFGVNAGIMLILHALLSSSDGIIMQSAAYATWAFVFSYFGAKILNQRGLLIPEEEVAREPEPAIYYCPNISPPSSNGDMEAKEKVIYYCPNCNSTFSDAIEKNIFCRVCGHSLVETIVRLDEWRGLSKEEKREYKRILRDEKKQSPIGIKTKISQEKWQDTSKEERQKLLLSWGINNEGEMRIIDSDLNQQDKDNRAVNYENNELTEKKETIESEVNPPGSKEDKICAVNTENKSFSDTESILFCRKCGAKIPLDSFFCQKCGERVVFAEK